MDTANDNKDAAGETEEVNFKAKYLKLTAKLREHIECPVCLETPRSCPVPVCPNGHFVCHVCKRDICPTCRVVMGRGKSTLAVTVLENIEHDCPNVGCDGLLPLDQYEEHLLSCLHRLVDCPVNECKKKVSFSELIDHLKHSCEASTPVEDLTKIKFPRAWNYEYFGTGTGYWSSDVLLWKGEHFVISVNNFTEFELWEFTVQQLGPQEKCSKFRFSLTVHAHNDYERKGKFLQVFSGEPFSVDVEESKRRTYAVTLKDRQMKQIMGPVGADGLFEFCVSLELTCEDG
eukprot:GFUD01035050.1.p1 GENE.GFUD01035050.1~~GFUD01035050.1.p1  ORF type:complete len:288 (+),score=48.45 GFUD01035050.1:103-966(+)